MEFGQKSGKKRQGNFDFIKCWEPMLGSLQGTDYLNAPWRFHIWCSWGATLDSKSSHGRLHCSVKMHSPLPFQVKELVGSDLFSRYDRLLLQSSLDMMSDIMYCPRKLCQSVVLVDQENNMGQCPECHLAFCIFCRLVYHGVSPCRLKAGGKLGTSG